MGTPQTPPEQPGAPASRRPEGVHELPRRRRSKAPWTRFALRTATSWAAPFYLVLHFGVVGMVVYSSGDRGTWAVAWWYAAAVYAASTVLFRHPGWLYPTIGAAVVAYLTTLRLISEGSSFYNAMVALAAPAWVLAVLAWAVAGRRPVSVGSGPWPALGARRAWTFPWAAPLLVCGTVVLALSGLGSLPEADSGVRTAVAYLVLLAALALLWRGRTEAWISVAFACAAFEQWMRLAGVPLVEQSPRWAAVALAMVLVSTVVRRPSLGLLRLWHDALYTGSMGVGAGALLLALGVHAGSLNDPSLQGLAATTALTGLTLVAHGFEGRRRLPVYLGVAFLEAGYMLQLLFSDVGQPQAFVLPAGLYLLSVGYLEWRRGSVPRVKRTLESAGLALLMGVSLLQAVGFLGDGHDRYVYDTFLLVESLAIFGLGAVLRWKRTFFGAAATLVADVLILLADPLRAMNTWYLVAVVGFAMIGLVVAVEQRRQQIPLWLDDWRRRLETWD